MKQLWQKEKNPFGKLNNDSMFLLNDMKSTFHDKTIKKIWRNGSIKNLSVNVINGAVWLKQLVETLLPFQKNN